jgi:LAO/AO transport system kinase
VKIKIEDEIKKRAIDGKISCQVARKIAENLSVPYKDVGKIADEMHIKITHCELGCF